jgi:hypothetical protein
MRDDDDDVLANIDLSAWTPPAPPSSLVDDVIARVTAPPPVVHASRAKRWWIAGAVAAAVAAVAAFALWGVERAPVPTTAIGEHPAARPDYDAEVARLTAELERVQREIDRHQIGGPSPAVERAKEELERKQRALRPLVDKIDHLKGKSPQAAACDEVTCVLTNDEPACCAKYRKPSPPIADSLDRNAIDKAVDAIKPQVMACGGSFAGMMKLGGMVAPSGELTVSHVTGPDGTDKPADVAACIHGAALNLTFPKTRKGGSFTYPFVFEAKPACDAAFLVEKGNALANAGFWDKALARFEDALACAPSDATTKRAFAAACNAKLAAKAKLYYGKLAASARTQLAPLCARNGIALDGR